MQKQPQPPNTVPGFICKWYLFWDNTFLERMQLVHCQYIMTKDHNKPSKDVDLNFRINNIVIDIIIRIIVKIFIHINFIIHILVMLFEHLWLHLITLCSRYFRKSLILETQSTELCFSNYLYVSRDLQYIILCFVIIHWQNIIYIYKIHKYQFRICFFPEDRQMTGR